MPVKLINIIAPVRNFSRAIVPVTSCPASGTSSSIVIAQGRSKNIQYLTSFSPPTFLHSSSAQNSFILHRTGKLFTSRHHNLQNQFFQKFRMASATITPRNSFSTAVLQPETDALDESVDPVQRQLLEEQCIVLNDKDQAIGHDTKRNCHRVINGDVLLHRAFSVFLFNGKGELLLQQRSKTKITFPLLWTNTCCSHPLYTTSELEEKDAIGVKRAARRRMEIELGIPCNSIHLDEFQYITRIHYKALSDSIWGEHEIDYILFLQKDDLQVNPSPDEIQEIRWVSLEKVKEMVATENVSLTPWFELILNSRLPDWWKNMKNLKQFEDHDVIHRM